MLKTVKAKFTNGAIVPLEPLDIEEGEEVLVTLEDGSNGSVEAEDAGLAWAIAEGLNTEPVSKQRVLDDSAEAGWSLNTGPQLHLWTYHAINSTIAPTDRSHDLM